MRIDVLIFGAGAAGLWCLDRIRRAGFTALLLESFAIGRGQTIQAQALFMAAGNTRYAERGTLLLSRLRRRCRSDGGEASPGSSNRT
jgi:succinate dehydrogenase/fumarate reductase flavoprotein subunit